MFDPVNDDCIDCGNKIDPTRDRNYIVFDDKNQQYRRECAGCHDAKKHIHLGRRTFSDANLHEM